MKENGKDVECGVGSRVTDGEVRQMHKRTKQRGMESEENVGLGEG